MTHMLHVETPVLKITEKILAPERHEMTYKGVFVINTRNKLLKEYLEDNQLSVVATELIDYMRDEICRLRDELDEKEDRIAALKEAAKTLIEAASWRDSE